MKVRDKTGKHAESCFIDFYERNNGHVYRFEDNYDVNFTRQTTRKIAVSEKPSDFILTHHGVTEYVEVKSSSKPSFPFSRIRKSQWRHMPRILKSGGKYFFYLHFHLENAELWFKVPAQAILRHEKKSFSVRDLQAHPDVVQLSFT